jgi:hypothetical protein
VVRNDGTAPTDEKTMPEFIGTLTGKSTPTEIDPTRLAANVALWENQWL